MIELKFLKKFMLIRQASQRCDICHYQHFSNKSSKFQPNACNRCHDLLMMYMNLSDIAILNIKDSDHRCILAELATEAINLMQNIDLTEKSRTL